ncbi:NAD binding Rossmann fold oxidoreductase [Purpureocillium lavendulum]|uniref:NAD binding Rossmann fold oxidoreductase n=1 Tax=Purpureocillium lavendulum TaxID=1247861 RepID=A0AB34FK56_9HYPO|nr:NAD binding Rossmann fold oxidoreductase [Purpureocillium lavendulum]
MAYEAVNPSIVQYPYSSPRDSRVSKWWPIAFFSAGVVFVITGAVLIATATNVDSDYFDDHSAEFYAGVACLVIGCVLKLTAWVLFVIWCVQGRRRQPPAPVYVNQPMGYGVPTIGPQPGYETAPMQPSVPMLQYQNMQPAPKGSPPTIHTQY